MGRETVAFIYHFSWFSVTLFLVKRWLPKSRRSRKFPLLLLCKAIYLPVTLKYAQEFLSW